MRRETDKYRQLAEKQKLVLQGQKKKIAQLRRKFKREKDLCDSKNKTTNPVNPQTKEDDDQTAPKPKPKPKPTPTPKPNDGGKPSGDHGKATTTRYWDCSGGSCGCSFGTSSNPVFCSGNAMFKAPPGNPYGAKFYGSAAISEALGGDWWMSKACGRCYKVTGRANIGDHNEESTLVLRAVDFCPPANKVCSNGKIHFDISAPGFDWAGASLHNRCDSN